jgi:hypothetical protein
MKEGKMDFKEEKAVAGMTDYVFRSDLAIRSTPQSPAHRIYICYDAALQALRSLICNDA